MSHSPGMEEAMALWSDFESVSLNPQYQLGRLSRSEGRLAWFQATSPVGEAVTISITETLNDEAELLERLRALIEVSNPHLIAIREVNPATVLDTLVVYAVMELTGESLGDILRERVLEAGEAREVLEAVVQGTAALHARGFVHGRIEPDNVIAVGQEIKLRSDCAHRVVAGPEFEKAAAQDVRQIGELMARSLARRWVRGENDPSIQLLPAPFAAVVRRAFSGHATVAELATLAGLPSPYAAYASQTQAAVPVAQATGEAAAPKMEAASAAAGAEEEKATPPGAGSGAAASPASRMEAVKPPAEARPRPGNAEPLPAWSARDFSGPGLSGHGFSGRTNAKAGPARREDAQPPLLFDEEEEESSSIFRRKSAPYFIGAAAVLLLAVLLLFHSLAGHHQAVAHNTAAANPAPAPAASRAPAAPAVASEPAKPTPAAPTGDWRVIAYTYNHRSQAAHKVRTIARRHPQLNPTVFAPRGDQGPFLVELGGPMSREKAAQLRATALRLRLARDTFIRNYR
jgi:eukaryotic-like serine/threonine-protein kinase